MPSDDEKIAELSAIVAAVRDRVHNGHAHPEAAAAGDGSVSPVRAVPIDLMPIVHVRDAAQAKVAAIGGVNPRAGGLLNRLVQAAKKLIARSLQWFVRDQIVFNRESVAAMEAVIEALDEQNRAMQQLCSQVNDRLLPLHPIAAEVPWLKLGLDEQRTELGRQRAECEASRAEYEASRARMESSLEALHTKLEEWAARERNSRELLMSEAAELKDVRTHWSQWRIDWEQKLATNEIQFLRAAADLQSAFQHRVTMIEANFREIVKGQHADYLGALDRTNLLLQRQFAADLARVRETYERMIHSELRLIRMRGAPTAAVSPSPGTVTSAEPVATPSLDYSRFAERFRGSEDEIRKGIGFYRPFFEGRDRVLDIGCGRGEFLEVMRDAGVHALGIDLSDESIARCREKGLNAQVADLFTYLASQHDGEFDGILSSQVVEHLPAARIPEMIRLCASKLRSGGILALETPNPECLAIFATYFYLDPTHTRPMPHQYLQFCMEEAGMTGFEVHQLSPAIETMPELASLPADFRERFFGGLDYAIIGRKI